MLNLKDFASVNKLHQFNAMLPELVTCWIARIIAVSLLGIAIYLFKNERKKCIELDDGTSTSKNIYKKILNCWSTIAFSLCIISSSLLFIETFIGICTYIQSYSSGFILVTQLTLTFYQVTPNLHFQFAPFYDFCKLKQIARLQYLFSMKQIIVRRYGYHESVFIIFYAIGMLLVLYISIVPIKYFPVSSNQYQCLSYAATSRTSAGLAVYGIFYFLWDWLVLFAYVKKCNKLTKRSVNNEVIYKIESVIKKNIMLTICYEINIIASFVVVLLTNVWWVYLKEIKFVRSIGILMTMSIMYLMMEHNNAAYVKLARLLRRSHLCCCCRSCLEIKPLDNATTTTTKKDANAGSDLTVKVTKNAEITMTQILEMNASTKVPKRNEETTVASGYDPERTTSSDLSQEKIKNIIFIEKMRRIELDMSMQIS